MEEPGRLQSMGLRRVGHTERLNFHFSLSYIGEGNGNPLQCSCLENPRDGESGGLLSMGSHRVGHNWSDLAVVMWELDYKESWVLKNWCFWTVVLEKTPESPLDFKEIKPVSPQGSQSEYSLEGLMLKLKLQHFGHLMQRADSLEKTLMLGGIGGRRRRGWQRMRRLDGITDLMDMSLSELWEFGDRQWRPGVLQFMGSQRVGHDWAPELNCRIQLSLYRYIYRSI